MRSAISHTLLLLILLPGICQAQRYSTNDVLTLTNRELREKTDAHLFRFFTYERSQSFYEFKKGKNKSRFKIMPEQKRLRKSFTSAHIVYSFVLPYPDCQWFDTVRGSVSVDIAVDSQMTVKTEPDLDFIPDFVLNYEKCHVISRDRAIDAAMKDDMKSGVTPPYAYLRYLPEKKRSVWVVLRTIWNNEDFNNDKPTKDDMVIIDAEIGRVLEHKVIPFAPHEN